MNNKEDFQGLELIDSIRGKRVDSIPVFINSDLHSINVKFRKSAGEISMVIDSGATISAIREEDLKISGASIITSSREMTVSDYKNNKITYNLNYLNNLYLGSHMFTNVPYILVKNSQFSLLGLDVLSYFNMYMLFDHNKLNLFKRNLEWDRAGNRLTHQKWYEDMMIHYVASEPKEDMSVKLNNTSNADNENNVYQKRLQDIVGNLYKDL